MTTIQLERKPEGYRNEYTHAYSITSVRPSLWRAKRGWMLHRIRFASIFVNQGSRMAATWWCGNQTNGPVPFRPECDGDLRECSVCKAKADR